MKIFVMLFVFCLINSDKIYSQYSIKIGMGFELVSQEPYDNKIPTEQFILCHYEISDKVTLGAGFRRFVNSDSYVGIFSTENQGNNTYFGGREDGKIYSNEYLISVARKFYDFSLQFDIGFTRSKMENRLWVQSFRSSDDSIESEAFINKTYRWNNFLRSSLSLEYNIRILKQFEVVPFIQFMKDIRSKSIDYTLDSIEEIPNEFMSTALNEFNTDVKRLPDQEPKYFVFGVAMKYNL